VTAVRSRRPIAVRDSVESLEGPPAPSSADASLRPGAGAVARHPQCDRRNLRLVGVSQVATSASAHRQISLRLRRIRPLPQATSGESDLESASAPPQTFVRP
jgi:hypothetical protein